MDAEIIIVGAGAIGLAIAHKISKMGHSVILLEKEAQYGAGVSSRSTEVIHAGIYYQKNSLKAVLCIKGKELLYEHCARYNVMHKRIGKIFIAVTAEEVSKLEATFAQARENGLDNLVELDEKALKDIEPNVRGKKALLSPSSGIFDTHGFMKSVFVLGRSSGAIFAASHPVIGADPVNGGWKVRVGGEKPASVSCRIVINAAGLYAIELSKKVFGKNREIPTLYPTKGSYLRYSGASYVKHILYPCFVPGMIEERIDATPDLTGSLRFGPSIEKTAGLEDFGVDPDFAKRVMGSIKRYLPAIDSSRIYPDCSGIRPKIYGEDQPVQDFRFDWSADGHWLDLWGMESPGLTASLAIADHVYGLIKERGVLYDRLR